MRLVVRAVLVGLLFGLAAITVNSGSASAASDLTLVNGPRPVAVRAGTPQTLLQFVRSEGPTGPAVANQAVNVEITAGPNTGVSSVVYSDENGLAIWKYPTQDLFPQGGTDTVRAWIDDNGNGAFETDEPFTLNDLVTLPYTNETPLAGDIETSVPGNAPADIQLSGSDPDGSFVGFAIDTKPENGTVPGFLTGPFLTYTPNDGFVGTDSFTYTVTDADGASALGTVTIEVREPDAQPSVEVVADFAITPDADANPLAVTVTSEATVEGGTIELTSWDFGDGTAPVEAESGTHVYAQAGTFNITMTVTDSTGAETAVTKSVSVERADETQTCDGRAVTIAMQSWQASVFGTPGPDVILGTPYADRIYSLDGDDVVCGNGGEDFVYLGNGNDKFVAGDSDDVTVFGEDGDDHITVPGMRSEIRGGGGNDRITAGPSASIWGNDGDDTVLVNGRGWIHGGNGNDTITVGPRSHVWPGNGDDTVVMGKDSELHD